MRKAAWGAVGLAVFAVASMRPVAHYSLALHGILSLGALAGYLLLGWDPPTAHRRYRAFLIAGVVAALASFVLVQTAGSERIIIALADLIAVAVIALPLWLLSRATQPVFAAAGAIAVAGPYLAVTATYSAPDIASVVAFALAGGAALFVAFRLQNPVSVTGERKKPRVVVAYDVVRLTDEEKQERLAALEKRFRAGEIEEHKYWDKRQEIESR